MINLLPPQTASAIRFGRQNTVLRNWLLAILLAVAGLALIIAAGWVYLNQQSRSLQSSIDVTNQQLKAQDLAQVQKDAKEITGDIKVINQVLGTEINFSGLIQAIGQNMPSGTILGSLSLSKVSGALDLSANSTDYASAAQIAVNLSDPQNNLFSKVDIVNISCSSATTSNYKCGATFRALFSNTAKAKFQNVPKESQ